VVWFSVVGGVFWKMAFEKRVNEALLSASKTPGSPVSQLRWLEAMVRSHLRTLNGVNCSTALGGFARACKKSQACVPKSSVLRGLLERAQFCARTGEPNARSLAGIVWACASLEKFLSDKKDILEDLLKDCVDCAREKDECFTGVEVSLMIWGLGKFPHLVGRDAKDLCLKLVESARGRNLYLSPQAVANILNGLGNLEIQEPCPWILRQLSVNIMNFKPLELSSGFHGLAKLGPANRPSEELIESARARVLAVCSQMEPNSVSSMMWAFAKFQDTSGQFASCFSVLLNGNRVKRLDDTRLSMALWAMQAMNELNGDTDKDLIDRLSAVFVERCPNLAANLLSQGLYSLSRLGKTEVFSTLDVESLKKQTWTSIDLDNLANAMLKANFSSEKLRKFLEKKTLTLLDESAISPRNLTSVCLAQAKAGGASARFIASTEKFMLRMIESLGPRDLANFVWALAMLGGGAPAAFRALGDRSVKIADQFNAQECSKLLHGMTRAGVRHHELDACVTEAKLQVFNINGIEMRLRSLLAGGRKIQRKRESTGATGATGAALWESSRALAEYLSRNDFRGKRCVVEIGAGLGLCSILLGKQFQISKEKGHVELIATDGDAEVIKLLEGNVSMNEVDVKTKILKWEEDCGDPLQKLGLATKPDLIIGTGIVYGSNPDTWIALAKLLKRLSGSSTQILLAHGNGAAPGILKCKGDFYEKIQKRFSIKKISQSELAREFQKSCQIHILTKHNKRKRVMMK